MARTDSADSISQLALQKTVSSSAACSLFQFKIHIPQQNSIRIVDGLRNEEKLEGYSGVIASDECSSAAPPHRLDVRKYLSDCVKQRASSGGAILGEVSRRCRSAQVPRMQFTDTGQQQLSLHGQALRPPSTRQKPTPWLRTSATARPWTASGELNRSSLNANSLSRHRRPVTARDTQRSYYINARPSTSAAAYSMFPDRHASQSEFQTDAFTITPAPFVAQTCASDQSEDTSDDKTKPNEWNVEQETTLDIDKLLLEAPPETVVTEKTLRPQTAPARSSDGEILSDSRYFFRPLLRRLMQPVSKDSGVMIRPEQQFGACLISSSCLEKMKKKQENMEEEKRKSQHDVERRRQRLYQRTKEVCVEAALLRSNRHRNNRLQARRSPYAHNFTIVINEETIQKAAGNAKSRPIPTRSF